MGAVHSISFCYLQLHLQFLLPAGTVATRSVLASSSSSGELQDLSAPFGGTEGQALDKHIELPDYLTARAEGLLLKEH